MDKRDTKHQRMIDDWRLDMLRRDWSDMDARKRDWWAEEAGTALLLVLIYFLARVYVL